jgi:hypothetical protein
MRAWGEGPFDNDEETAATWVRRTVNLAPSGELLAAALAALARVRSDQSELAELWAESDAAAWLDSVARLEVLLRT